MELKRKNVTERQRERTGIWSATVKGTLAGIAAVLAVLMLAAGLIVGGVIPEKSIDICVAAAMAIGAAASVLTTSLTGGGRGGICGILNGAILAAVCGASGYLLYSRLDAASCLLNTAFCAVSGGLIGGLCGQKRRKRR